MSIAGEASLITGLMGLDQSPDTSFDDSEAGGTVRSSGGHSGKLRFRQKINLGDSMMSELTEARSRYGLHIPIVCAARLIPFSTLKVVPCHSTAGQRPVIQ